MVVGAGYTVDWEVDAELFDDGLEYFRLDRRKAILYTMVCLGLDLTPRSFSHAYSYRITVCLAL